ncbi:VWA domain-containing protein [Actinoplanes sp. NPDC049265]|uniref:VWA domain-containing protein n=1 Tax=Actinoplanes sp. NPDC049265 TaxID=3363902 RepID=UPI00371F7870
MTDFTLSLSEHRYLAPGATEINAILTVRADPDAHAEPAPAGLAEVVVVDASGSMSIHDKMAAARRATVAAIEALPDGARFAVVAGDNDARMVFPSGEDLAVAGPRTRQAARTAIGRVRPSGGTRIGAWLRLARRLLAGRDDDVRHVTLLTDGQNRERAGELTRTLDDCRQVFQCDARGIGADWSADELIAIAQALRGQARAMTAGPALAADFRAVVGRWQAKAVRDLTLRIELSPFARLRWFREVHPTKNDLAAHTTPAGERAVNVATGAWAPGELRDYELSVDVGAAGQFDVDMRAGRVDALTGGSARSEPVVVLVRRTEGEALSVTRAGKSGRYELEARMSRWIGDGCAAYVADDRAGAERALGQAAAIAYLAGDQDMLDRIARVAEIVDAGNGKVRLRPDVPPEDWLALALDKEYSRSFREARCVCGYESPPGATTCLECRRPL